MQGWFVLNGQGGELDRKEYNVNDIDELNEKFREWIRDILITEGDTIRIASAD